MKRIAVDGLPDEPLSAAGVFHQHWLAHVESILEAGEDVMLVLPSADHTHRDDRRVRGGTASTCAYSLDLGERGRCDARADATQGGPIALFDFGACR